MKLSLQVTRFSVTACVNIVTPSNLKQIIHWHPRCCNLVTFVRYLALVLMTSANHSVRH